MKKWVCWGILYFSVLSLYAQPQVNQVDPAGVRSGTDPLIYIASVKGDGGDPGDAAFISVLLLEAVKARDYITISSPRAADYVLSGTIAPYTKLADVGEETPDETETDSAAAPAPAPAPTVIRSINAVGSGLDEDDNPFSGMYVFTLTLTDNYNKIIMAEQELVYVSLEDFQQFFPTLMNNVLYSPLEKTFDEYYWRDKWLYAKASAAWTPRVYHGEYESTYYPNFGGGIGAEVQFFDFLSLEFALEMAPDWVLNTPTYEDRYLDLIMEIPIFVKYIFKPFGYYMIEPYTGVQFNISLFGNAIPPICSWVLGVQYGVKVGSGVLFIEPRLAWDIGSSSLYIPRIGIETDAYQRFVMYFGAGYKYGFFKRKKSTKQKQTANVLIQAGE